MPFISVCVCTYKRPQLLRRLLQDLCRQDTGGTFSYGIIVVDNDRDESAKSVVVEYQKLASVAIQYFVEPEQNIALARNKAVAVAGGDYLAFIDDDEFPTPEWLLILFRNLTERRVDGVLGPVKPFFETAPPQWVAKGKFYERPTYPTGFVIDWRKGRTGNVLLRRDLFVPGEVAFRPDFLTGEDQDFFRRMIEKGRRFIWCNEAVAYEVVPPIRWRRSYMLRRALLRGRISLVHPSFGATEVLKSFLAVPAYTLVLPLMLLSGQHRFMKYLIKTFDHAGRLLAWLGVQAGPDRYVTD